MNELTKCAKCGQPLVSHEFVHALRGNLYCSKKCVVTALARENIARASELAEETYVDEAEVVRTEDVLSEDLQSVRVSITCTTTIKLPKSFTKDEAITEARKLLDEGYIAAEPDDCDEVIINCELVTDKNSSHNTED